jgi:hypothetical protein
MALWLVACSSGTSSGPTPPAPISVSFLNPPATSLNVGTSTGFIATVSNDASNAGVTWKVSCGSTSCGTINPSSTPSGGTATYTAPSAVPTPAAVTITHRGVAKMLLPLSELSGTDGNFADVKIDCRKEFLEAIHLGDFDTVADGFAEITHHRVYSRPKPPDKAISTIHKAKGLECASVIVMPCDAQSFPNSHEARISFL